MNGKRNSVKGKEFIQWFHIKTNPCKGPFLAFPLGGLYTQVQLYNLAKVVYYTIVS